jgi:hypothetical protein
MRSIKKNNHKGSVKRRKTSRKSTRKRIKSVRKGGQKGGWPWSSRCKECKVRHDRTEIYDSHHCTCTPMVGTALKHGEGPCRDPEDKCPTYK